MNSTLHEVFDARAARADADPDAILDAVHGRADRHVRRRRHLAGAGTGLVLVSALAAGLVVLTSGHDPAPTRPTVAPGGKPTTASAPRSTLTRVAPAPSTAEVSIGLVPAGWVLLSARGPVTLYGPPSLAGSYYGSFAGKLVVCVSERYGTSGRHPLTIAGRPGSYFDKTSPDSYQGADVIVDAKTEVNFQLPDSIHLSRADVLRLANTLDIRSTTEKTHG